VAGREQLKAWGSRQSWEGWVDKWLHRITIPLIVAVTVYMLVAVRPPDVDLSDDPSFTDVLFNNRAVVLAAWIIVVDGAIYLFASLIARSAQKSWAKQAGPVSTDTDGDQPQNLQQVPAAYERDAEQARQRIAELEQQLEALDGDYQSAIDDLHARERELAECRSRNENEQQS
jgi:hypothetical protein